MTYEEMKAQAEASVRTLIASRQRRWVMKKAELETLLITAYCKGHLDGVERSVVKLAPFSYSDFKKLVNE